MEMKHNWKTYLFWIALAEGVGALAGWLTRDGTAFYKEFVEKPALAPPAIVFPIVWGILYALMGFGAARVDEGLRLLHGLETNLAACLQTPQEA